MKLLVVAALAAGLCGCAPSLQSANSVGGIVTEGMGFRPGGDALARADAHCAKYGKAARASGENMWNGTLSFDCVTP